MGKLKPQGCLRLESLEFLQGSPFSGQDQTDVLSQWDPGGAWPGPQPEGISPLGHDLADLRQPAQPQRHGDGL